MNLVQVKDTRMKLVRLALICLLFDLLVSACENRVEANMPEIASSMTPDWFDVELTDAQTGESFTVNDYAGKVVLLETMAIWCPNCIIQANEIRNLHKVLGNPEDLVSVSLDVDVNEDNEALGKYANEYGFDWHFAIASNEVARALGNLYTAQYLNPPLAPMMIIDREGKVHHLEYGIKDAEMLQQEVEPFLTE